MSNADRKIRSQSFCIQPKTNQSKFAVSHSASSQKQTRANSYYLLHPAILPMQN